MSHADTLINHISDQGVQDAPLAAVGTALANDEGSQDRAVAEILRDVDMDAALAELLNGE
jgi:hypothetical protein